MIFFIINNIIIINSIWNVKKDLKAQDDIFYSCLNNSPNVKNVSIHSSMK